LAGLWEEAVHSLRGLPNVVDIRNLGLVAAIELAPRADGAGRRGYEVFLDCYQNGLQVRMTGDTVAMSPPLIVEAHDIEMAMDKLGGAIRRVA
jgi:beta-alanine--pyruvate transaminase